MLQSLIQCAFAAWSNVRKVTTAWTASRMTHHWALLDAVPLAQSLCPLGTVNLTSPRYLQHFIIPHCRIISIPLVASVSRWSRICSGCPFIAPFSTTPRAGTLPKCISIFRWPQKDKTLSLTHQPQSAGAAARHNFPWSEPWSYLHTVLQVLKCLDGTEQLCDIERKEGHAHCCCRGNERREGRRS